MHSSYSFLFSRNIKIGGLELFPQDDDRDIVPLENLEISERMGLIFLSYVRHRAIANSTLTCLQRIHWRFRSDGGSSSNAKRRLVLKDQLGGTGLELGEKNGLNTHRTS